MTVSINGIAHIYISVSDFDAALPFYRRLLEFLEMRCLVETEDLYYCVGGRTGVGIRRALHPEPFDQYRAGLHHLCFRARSTADVDAIAQQVEPFGGRIVNAPRLDDWAPGYYSVLFEDPCGTRQHRLGRQGDSRLFQVTVAAAAEVHNLLSAAGHGDDSGRGAALAGHVAPTLDVAVGVEPQPLPCELR